MTKHVTRGRKGRKGRKGTKSTKGRKGRKSTKGRKSRQNAGGKEPRFIRDSTRKTGWRIETSEEAEARWQAEEDAASEERQRQMHLRKVERYQDEQKRKNEELRMARDIKAEIKSINANSLNAHKKHLAARGETEEEYQKREAEEETDDDDLPGDNTYYAEKPQKKGWWWQNF
jgi:hypothetical protein